MSTAWRCKEYCSANRRSWLRRWPMSSNREDRSSGESVSSTVRTLPLGGPSERRRSMRSSPFSTRLTVTSSLLWCSSCSFMASALFDHAAHGLKQSGEATKFGVEFAADVFRELSVASEAGGIDFLQMSPICRKQCCDRPAPRLRRWVERYLGDEVPDFAAELLHQLAQPGLLLCCSAVRSSSTRLRTPGFLSSHSRMASHIFSTSRRSTDTTRRWFSPRRSLSLVFGISALFHDQHGARRELCEVLRSAAPDPAEDL